ncbi:vitamin K epoxide reductase family protein [Candidatus Parvarchaeota archaeon]|nr:vitamin K epoxide reductase family protein [Candidatus Parvarchaeota archaeon]
MLKEYRVILAYLLIAFSLLGLGAMMYIILSFNLGVVPTSGCPIYQNIDCGKVVTSAYSKFYGIDLSQLGAGFFALMLALSVYIFVSKNRRVKTRVNYIMLGLGIIASGIAIYLIYLELFVIHYICLYCTFGHISIFGLTITSAILLKSRNSD